MTEPLRLPDPSLVDRYLSLPWTIETGRTEDGVTYARCAQIPDAVAFAEDPAAIDALFWDALRATLEALLACGEPVPVPAASLRKVREDRKVVVRPSPIGTADAEALEVNDESEGVASSQQPEPVPA